MEFKETNIWSQGDDDISLNIKRHLATCDGCNVSFGTDFIAGKPVFYYTSSAGKNYCSQECMDTHNKEEHHVDVPSILKAMNVPDVLCRATMDDLPDKSTPMWFVQSASSSLLVTGTQTGVGKSYIAAACMTEWINIYGEDKEKRKMWFITPHGLMGAVSQAIQSNKSQFIVEEYAKNVPLLVLDDLGTEKTTDTVRAMLFSIIDHRVSESKPFIITTNLTLDELVKVYSSRIVSRLSTGGYMEVTGGDRRTR